MGRKPALYRNNLTFRYESLRAIASGILDTGPTTVFLLVAVQYFNATALQKSLIAAATSIGFLISPLIVYSTERQQLRISQAASILCLVSALTFLLAYYFANLETFVIGSVVGIAMLSASVPLYTQIYQDKYPKESRGSVFSRTVMIRIGSAVVFSYIAGGALEIKLENYQELLLSFFCASLFSAYCLNKIDTKRMDYNVRRSPLSALRFVKSDSLFRHTLICWMLMGIANLTMLPLRIEMLANPQYGLNLSIAKIALIVGVIPNAARFLLSPIWGILFDKLDFFLLRVILNIGFAIGIFSFFASNSEAGLIFGAIMFGISNAGGEIAWGLWVTKFAPENHVADYMSVHSFFTGVRGLFAPFLGFYGIKLFSMFTISCISTSLIIIASLMLLPEYFKEKKRRRITTPDFIAQ